MTGSELHEPKGAASAALGTVYVADGAGSGSWSSVGTSAFTGVVADFLAPVVPSGWLELDGSTISTTTYSALFAVLSITTAGTRTNGSPVVTSIASTTNFIAGYYVFGTGIASGTTILSVDSATQITLSANASSSGTSTFYVSPFTMNTGTITLPNVYAGGRYRRSRGASQKVGDLQADVLKAHTHTLSGTADSTTPTFTGTGATISSTSSGTPVFKGSGVVITAGPGAGSTLDGLQPGTGSLASVSSSASYTPAGTVSAHTHTLTGTATSTGDAETRPITLVVMTCIKT